MSNRWLNYHHLLYFWTVAREGGLVPAAAVLRLSHPTLSTQVRTLEDSLGHKLFQKRGRRLELTEAGRTAFRYADEIFGLGRELIETVREERVDRPMRLAVGVVDVVPKMLVRTLLQPALRAFAPLQLTCSEGAHDELLAELALHRLDILISEAPIAAGASVRAFNHLLGESDVSVLAAPTLAPRYRAGFPRSLDGAPMLLPLAGSVLRRGLDSWFAQLGVTPQIVAEAEDSALLKAFATDGMGLVTCPTVIAPTVAKRYALRSVGRTDSVRERFYAITAERRLAHPAVIAIRDAARHRLFSA